MDAICDLYDFIQAVAIVDTNIFSTEAWWRGQPDIQLDIRPSIFRDKTFPAGWSAEKERNLTIRFLLGAMTRHARWVEGDNSHCLAVMRHYGLATRLLDWTASPLFALFFAVQQETDVDAALWVLCPAALNQIEFGRSRILSPYVDPDVKSLFGAPFHEMSDVPPKVAAVAIREVDIRMSVQLAAFTIHGDPRPLNLRPDSGDFLRMFRIPSKSKSSFRDQLFSLGIRQSNLFPDLENLAAELNMAARNEDIRTVPALGKA